MCYYVKQQMKTKSLPKEEFEKQFVICECGYNNKKEFVDKSGICNRCGEILDDKAYFKRILGNELHLWKGKKWK